MEQKTIFGDIPREYFELEKSAIVILPVPYDGTSTWLKGADQGPSAIIEASANMELYDIETDSEVYKNGIYTAHALEKISSPEKVIEVVAREVRQYIDSNKFVVVIGGEHTVSVGSVKSHVDKYADITVLQLDAHSDLRNEYEGSRYNHACVMARIKELCPVMQVGIRSMDSSEKTSLEIGRTVFAKDINTDSMWVEKALAGLSEKVYITIDLDVLDPSIMPSTGTPEPGGLFWYDLILLLKAVFDDKEVVGFDVVELCPNPGNKAPDFLAAKLIYKLLSYKFKK